MTTLNWVDGGNDSWIETESDSYDYTIERNGNRYTLRRFVYDGEQLLSAIPCMNLEAAKTTAQMMEDLVPKQKAKLATTMSLTDAKKVLYGFEKPDWRDQ